MAAAFLVIARVLSSPESLVAQVVTLAGAALVVGLAGRLYAGALLAGDKLTWRDALRAEPIR